MTLRGLKEVLWTREPGRLFSKPKLAVPPQATSLTSLSHSSDPLVDSGNRQFLCWRALTKKEGRVLIIECLWYKTQPLSKIEILPLHCWRKRMTTQVVVEPGIYLGVPILCQWLRKPPQCLHMNSELILSLLCLENRVLRHSSWRGHFENMGSQSALRTLFHSALRKTEDTFSPILQIGSLRLRELEWVALDPTMRKWPETDLDPSPDCYWKLFSACHLGRIIVWLACDGLPFSSMAELFILPIS